MDHLKLAMPQSGAPKTGLLQFGDELPGLYITAEDAFVLRLEIDGVEAIALNVGSVDDDSTVSEIQDACEEVAAAADEITQKLANLRRLLALSPFGSVAHLQKLREARPTPLAAVA